MSFGLDVVFGLFASAIRCGAVVGGCFSFLGQVASSLFSLPASLTVMGAAVTCVSFSVVRGEGLLHLLHVSCLTYSDGSRSDLCSSFSVVRAEGLLHLLHVSCLLKLHWESLIWKSCHSLKTVLIEKGEIKSQRT